MKPFKLSPSDFAFLWEECPRCFYEKVVHGRGRPRAPMPKIFTQIDTAMRRAFDGKRLDAIVPGAPAGVIGYGEAWVQSAVFVPPGARASCFVRGRLDSIARLVGGGFAVIDRKTANPREEHVALYCRQLHAYAYSLEHPAPRALALEPIERLGLLAFEPLLFAAPANGRGSVPSSLPALSGNLSWVEVQRDDRAFLGFLAEVVNLLDQPEPPPPGISCPYCSYQQGRREGRSFTARGTL